MDPDGGYVVSEERMIEDIRILKENNFNAVRTCHYPDDAVAGTTLCDTLRALRGGRGQPRIARHGATDEKTKNLAKQSRLRRRRIWNVTSAQRAAQTINHPSVIVWSHGQRGGRRPQFRTPATTGSRLTTRRARSITNSAVLQQRRTATPTSSARCTGTTANAKNTSRNNPAKTADPVRIRACDGQFAGRIQANIGTLIVANIRIIRAGSSGTSRTRSHAQNG